jgi:hypothetical protein
MRMCKESFPVPFPLVQIGFRGTGYENVKGTQLDRIVEFCLFILYFHGNEPALPLKAGNFLVRRVTTIC